MNSSNRNKRRYAPKHAAADVSRQWTRYEGATRGLAQKNSGQEKPNRTKDAGQVDGGGGGVGDVALPSSVVGCRHLLANLKTSGTCTMLQGTVPPLPSSPDRIPTEFSYVAAGSSFCRSQSRLPRPSLGSRRARFATTVSLQLTANSDARSRTRRHYPPRKTYLRTESLSPKE